MNNYPCFTNQTFLFNFFAWFFFPLQSCPFIREGIKFWNQKINVSASAVHHLIIIWIELFKCFICCQRLLVKLYWKSNFVKGGKKLSASSFWNNIVLFSPWKKKNNRSPSMTWRVLDICLIFVLEFCTGSSRNAL